MAEMRDDWIQFAGAQVPRYTSYPTAVDFVGSVDAHSVEGWLATIPAGEALSVYGLDRFVFVDCELD